MALKTKMRSKKRTTKMRKTKRIRGGSNAPPQTNAQSTAEPVAETQQADPKAVVIGKLNEVIEMVSQM